MNLNQPNIEDLKALLRENDDSVIRKLVVQTNGDVGFINPTGILPTEFDEKYKFHYETWLPKNGYSGNEAANDEVFVNSLYSSLIKNWEEGTSSIVSVINQ